MKDWAARVLRTLLQMIAGGGLTVFFDQAIRDIDPRYAPYVALGATLLVTFCQNIVEDAWGKAILKPSSPPAPADVEAVAKV